MFKNGTIVQHVNRSTEGSSANIGMGIVVGRHYEYPKIIIVDFLDYPRHQTFKIKGHGNEEFKNPIGVFHKNLKEAATANVPARDLV